MQSLVVLAMLPPASVINAWNAVELYLPPWGAAVPDVPDVAVEPDVAVVPVVAGRPARNAVQSPKRAFWLAGPVINAVMPDAEPDVLAGVTPDPGVDTPLPDCESVCVPF